jgi:hypothetical protein
MTETIKRRWGKWAALVAGVLVMLRTLAFVIARVFRVTRSEVSARGGDVNFVLRMAERRSGTR